MFFKKTTYFCSHLRKKIFFLQNIYGLHRHKNFIKIRPKMSKCKPIKKTFFSLLPILTYSAIYRDGNVAMKKLPEAQRTRQASSSYHQLIFGFASDSICICIYICICKTLRRQCCLQRT